MLDLKKSTFKSFCRQIEPNLLAFSWDRRFWVGDLGQFGWGCVEIGGFQYKLTGRQSNLCWDRRISIQIGGVSVQISFVGVKINRNWRWLSSNHRFLPLSVWRLGQHQRKSVQIEWMLEIWVVIGSEAQWQSLFQCSTSFNSLVVSISVEIENLNENLKIWIKFENLNENWKFQNLSENWKFANLKIFLKPKIKNLENLKIWNFNQNW